jgi:hypothetical protein
MRRKRDAPRERGNEGRKRKRGKGKKEKKKDKQGEEEGGFVNIKLILHFWRLYVTQTRNSEIYLF